MDNLSKQKQKVWQKYTREKKSEKITIEKEYCIQIEKKFNKRRDGMKMVS